MPFNDRTAFAWSAIVAASVALTPAPGRAELSSASRIGPTGVGPIVIGTSPAQAAATGTRFTSTSPAPGSSCFYLRPQAPPGLSFMVESGTLRRAEVVDSAIATTDGLRVGDPVAKVMARYGSRARMHPDKYDPQTRIVIIEPRGVDDAKYRLVFTIRGGTVAAIYAGALPQILYVEGCS